MLNLFTYQTLQSLGEAISKEDVLAMIREVEQSSGASELSQEGLRKMMTGGVKI